MPYTKLSNVNKTLTFDDVNIIPRYSDVSSRKHCDTTTHFTENFQIEIPIVAAPMTSVCGYNMAIAMWELGGVGIIHRFNTIEEQADIVDQVRKYIDRKKHTTFWTNDGPPLRFNNPVVSAAVGVKEGDIYRAEALLEAGANVILIDVAHGHHASVRDALSDLNRLRDKYDFDIIAGNIATKDGALFLEEHGANALRAGIGGGCFTPEMKVKTVGGLKSIKNVNVGDFVYTHNGQTKFVIDKLEFNRDEEIYEINGIECTHNHEFYVIHKDYENVVTDENYHDYAQWISAEELTEDYFLIEV